MSVITRDNKIEYFLRRREEEYSLDAFSATPPASESSQSTFPRVPPRSARVSPAVTHGAPPPEAALCGGGCECESRAVSGEYLQDHIQYARIELGDAVSESIYKTIYDSRGWR